MFPVLWFRLILVPVAVYLDVGQLFVGEATLADNSADADGGALFLGHRAIAHLSTGASLL